MLGENLLKFLISRILLSMKRLAQEILLQGTWIQVKIIAVHCVKPVLILYLLFQYVATSWKENLSTKSLKCIDLVVDN